jgi:lipopolysaccharide/colanic/teichoic acid biosynthesis glycosyltransferase
VPALQEPTEASRFYPIVKAIIEPVIAGAALLALSPLLIVIGALVKGTSEGPIFYGDLREGRHGKLFRCWKFRTMRANAAALQHTLVSKQQLDGPQFKMDKDPRVTRLGNFLRRTSLDELPQLFNVVLGDMSCIGPRPSPFNENQICVPWRNARLSVRPGISGLWQVCRFNRSEGDFHQWISYDLLYVNNVSLRTDFRIVVATFKTLLGFGPIKAEDITPVLASYMAGSPSVAEGRAWSQAFQDNAAGGGVAIAAHTHSPADTDREIRLESVALADVANDPAHPPVAIPPEWSGLSIFAEHQAASEPAN